MSNMSDLDITLSQHKLSDAQNSAIVELLNGPTTAKTNTLKSLEKRGILKYDTSVEGLWNFTDEFVQNNPSLFGEQPENLDREATSLLDGVEDEDAATAEWFRLNQENQGLLEDEAPFADGVERYQDSWAKWEKELSGFEATLAWRNTQVWDGLTASEIRADMDTAQVVNRAAKRKARKILKSMLKAS